MTKIPFENSEILQQAKVTIDGVDYPVTPAQMKAVQHYLSAEELNNMQSNIESAINTSNNYSTEEKQIGTWIDGKPLYRKVINTTSPICNTNGTYVISTIDVADNIDFAVIELAFIVDNANQIQTIPYINNAGNMIKAFITANKKIHLTHNVKDYSERQVTVVVKYTKTTD